MMPMACGTSTSSARTMFATRSIIRIPTRSGRSRTRGAVEVGPTPDQLSDRQGHPSERHAGLQVRPLQASLARGADSRRAARAGKGCRVDTTLRSTGGAAPLAPGEVPRPVTSGDVVAMYSKQAAA